MHRKKVTCELHDSYFRLMTTKHAIPKIEWAIDWALNYYITQSRQEVRQLELETRCGRESHTRLKGPSGPPDWIGDQRRRRQDVVGKATPGRRGPRDLRWSFGDPLVTSCSRESQQSGPRPSGWAAPENEKDTTLTAIRVGVNILQFCSVSNSLSL